VSLDLSSAFCRGGGGLGREEGRAAARSFLPPAAIMAELVVALDQEQVADEHQLRRAEHHFWTMHEIPVRLSPEVASAAMQAGGGKANGVQPQPGLRAA
jgi:hypothetical protein